MFFALQKPVQLSAQSLEQWSKTVQWDGVTHWSNYIKPYSKYMGPNALAVPALGTAGVDSVSRLSGSCQFNFAKGERSQSIIIQGNLALIKGFVSIDASYIPVEYYRMSDALKRERNVYYTEYYNNKARGDVLVNTNIQVHQNAKRNTYAALRLGFRLPSSSGFESARFIDGMGYNLDVTAGKRLKDTRFGLALMTGIYVWQVQTQDFRQDDAFLFGLGADYTGKAWTLKSSICGYLGYMENAGDKPILIRAEAQRKYNRLAIFTRVQHGLHDYLYTTLETGASFFFKKPVAQKLLAANRYSL